MIESTGMIKIGFTFTNEFGYTFSSESQLEIFDGYDELTALGEQFDTFLRQIGYRRNGTTVFMESINDEEYDFLANALKEYREGMKED